MYSFCRNTLQWALGLFMPWAVALGFWDKYKQWPICVVQSLVSVQSRREYLHKPQLSKKHAFIFHFYLKYTYTAFTIIKHTLWLSLSILWRVTEKGCMEIKGQHAESVGLSLLCMWRGHVGPSCSTWSSVMYKDSSSVSWITSHKDRLSFVCVWQCVAHGARVSLTRLSCCCSCITAFYRTNLILFLTVVLLLLLPF